MTKRTGKDIFIQHVERLFADRAPTIYFLDTYIHECSLVYSVITDVVNNLTGKYRTRRTIIDEGSNKILSTDYKYVRSGINGRVDVAGGLGPTPDDIRTAIDDIGGQGGRLTTDRMLLIFSALNEKFSDPSGGYRMVPLIDFDILSGLNDYAKQQRATVEIVPIYRAGHQSTADIRFNPECSVVVQTFDGIAFITLFGTKADEVYMFAYRDSYEPVAVRNAVNPEYVQHVQANGVDHRATIFGITSEFDINPFVAYKPGISSAAYYEIPHFTEKFTILDAAATPFDELLKLAAGVENGLSVICNSQPNPKVDGIAEEAGTAWREGKYASLSDNVQPGFSRNGTFIYKSALLKDLVVVSYNLLLKKENS